MSLLGQKIKRTKTEENENNENSQGKNKIKCNTNLIINPDSKMDIEKEKINNNNIENNK